MGQIYYIAMGVACYLASCLGCRGGRIPFHSRLKPNMQAYFLIAGHTYTVMGDALAEIS